MKTKRPLSLLKDQLDFSTETQDVDTRKDYLLKGCNGLESAVIISDRFGNAFGGPKVMDVEVVKFILKILNENEINYAIIGGLATGQHAIPRTTHDVDILIASNEVEKVRRIFKNYYKRGTEVVRIFDIKGTQLDVLPAKLRHRMQALEDAVETELFGVKTKVVTVRDLIVFKLLAIPDRPELDKRRLDEADITSLLRHNKNKISKEDIEYIGQNVIAMGYTKEDVKKYREVIQWLNETLDLLDMGDLRYSMD